MRKHDLFVDRRGSVQLVATAEQLREREDGVAEREDKRRPGADAMQSPCGAWLVSLSDARRTRRRAKGQSQWQLRPRRAYAGNTTYGFAWSVHEQRSPTRTQRPGLESGSTICLQLQRQFPTDSGQSTKSGHRLSSRWGGWLLRPPASRCAIVQLS